MATGFANGDRVSSDSFVSSEFSPGKKTKYGDSLLNAVMNSGNTSQGKHNNDMVTGGGAEDNSFGQRGKKRIISFPQEGSLSEDEIAVRDTEKPKTANNSDGTKQKLKRIVVNPDNLVLAENIKNSKRAKKNRRKNGFTEFEYGSSGKKKRNNKQRKAQNKNMVMLAARSSARNAITEFEDSLDLEENDGIRGIAKTRRGFVAASDFVEYISDSKANKKSRRRFEYGDFGKQYFKSGENDFLKGKNNPFIDNKRNAKALSKQAQKKALKKEYAKMFRASAGLSIEKTAAAVTSAANKLRFIARKIIDLAALKVKITVGVVVAIVSLLLITIMLAFVGFAASTTVQRAVEEASYPTSMSTIESIENRWRAMELELDYYMGHLSEFHSGYDDYDPVSDPIEHFPFDLANYINAAYPGQSLTDEELANLFWSYYQLEEEVETRTVSDSSITVLKVTLTSHENFDFLTTDFTDDQMFFYNAYEKYGGLCYKFDSPLHMNWYGAITSYYGPPDEKKLLGIGLEENTTVYAPCSGTVIDASGDHVIIKNSSGYYCYMYYLNSAAVRTGDTVTVGNIVGLTSSYLYLGAKEPDPSGGEPKWINPIFAYKNGNPTGYNSRDCNEYDPEDFKPHPTSGDPDVQKLLEFAALYLDTPYLDGGKDPSEGGFDSSGYISFVFTGSGYYPIEQVDEYSIYLYYCTPIDVKDLKPGDLVFFQGTKTTDLPVSEVGLYCGQGMMIYSGNPVKYTNINKPYWLSHLYSYARVNR